MNSFGARSGLAISSLTLALALNILIAAAVEQPASGRPTINSLSPTSGRVGTAVTIRGINLAGKNTIEFRSALVSFSAGSPVNSDTETKLEFHVTSCPSYALQCPGFFIPPGEYSVAVTNGNGTSNSVIFTITPP